MILDSDFKKIEENGEAKLRHWGFPTLSQLYEYTHVLISSKEDGLIKKFFPTSVANLQGVAQLAYLGYWGDCDMHGINMTEVEEGQFFPEFYHVKRVDIGYDSSYFLVKSKN